MIQQLSEQCEADINSFSKTLNIDADNLKQNVRAQQQKREINPLSPSATLKNRSQSRAGRTIKRLKENRSDNIDATKNKAKIVKPTKNKSSSQQSTCKRKPQKPCVHGRMNNGYYCQECPGKGICPHKKSRSRCKVCRPNGRKSRG
mmetsp:Transcript_34255/g.42246  ORF Transcript_34255/g.42246 Transcript_34255/m.42246 type:complete len:146 (-) Transcript_34255:286-723(-)